MISTDPFGIREKYLKNISLLKLHQKHEIMGNHGLTEAE